MQPQRRGLGGGPGGGRGDGEQPHPPQGPALRGRREVCSQVGGVSWLQAQFSLRPQKGSAILGPNSGPGGSQGAVESSPPPLPCPLPSQCPWASGRVPSGYRLGVSGPDCSVSVGRAPEIHPPVTAPTDLGGGQGVLGKEPGP